jgi:hypothetical protein
LDIDDSIDKKSELKVAYIDRWMNWCYFSNSVVVDDMNVVYFFVNLVNSV